MLLIAHAGHWLVSLAYIAPVVFFAGWVGWVTIRDRRAEARGEPAARGPKGSRGGPRAPNG